MSQNYVEIPSSKKISESLADILGNDKTVMSCNEGTAFPSSNLYKGMLCLRSDEMKLYQLTNVSSKTQICIADLNGVARHLEGGYGNCISYDNKDLNDWNAMPTGFYQGTNMLNAPSGDTMQRVLMVRYGGSNLIGNAHQMAFSHSSDIVMIRREIGGVWGKQQKIITGDLLDSTTTALVNGFNADKLDGYHAGNASGNIPVSNGTLNVNLNADKVDGYNVSNAANNIPINNGQVNRSLNADMIDGYHAGNGSGQVALANGVICSNLNAQMVGGITAERIMKIDTNNNPTQAYNDMTVATLRVTNLPNTRQYQGSWQAYSRLGTDERQDGTINIESIDSASVKYDYGPEYRYYFRTHTGVLAGNYSIFQLLQELVYRSHDHAVEKEQYRYNCKCLCYDNDRCCD